MPRESLTMTMEERYASQRAGGAFNAKTAGIGNNDIEDTEIYPDDESVEWLYNNMPAGGSFDAKSLNTHKYSP